VMRKFIELYPEDAELTTSAHCPSG
jgi:hypothetical protein